MNTQPIPLGELLNHPFQIHIPDMAGKEWADFLADVLARGVQDPIRVSNRTGAWVVVDGHQRLRAAKELGYTHLVALPQSFADEGEEVEYIAGSSRYRRNLTDAQRVRIARAQEEYFAEVGKEAQRAAGGDKLSEDRPLAPNLGQAVPPRHARSTDAKAAESVGLKRETYRKGKKIIEDAPAQVVKDWEAGGLSTDAAHQLTTAPKHIVKVLLDAKLTTPEAQLVLKDPVMRARVESGEVTPRVAADSLTALRKAHEKHLKDSGQKSLSLLVSVLTKLTDLSDAIIEDALRVGYDDDLRDFLERSENRLAVLRAGLEDRAGHHTGDFKTITVEVKAVA